MLKKSAKNIYFMEFDSEGKTYNSLGCYHRSRIVVKPLKIQINFVFPWYMCFYLFQWAEERMPDDTLIRRHEV